MLQQDIIREQRFLASDKQYHTKFKKGLRNRSALGDEHQVSNGAGLLVNGC